MTHIVMAAIPETIPDQYAQLQEILTEANDEPVVVIHEICFSGLWPVLLGAPGIRPTPNRYFVRATSG